VLAVPVRTVRMATWKGRTIMMMWQFDDVAHFRWMIVDISDVDTCSFMGKLYEDTWPNRRAPRVPLIFGLCGCVKVYGESVGFNP